VNAQAVLAEMRRRLGEALVTIGADTPDYPVELLMDYVFGAALYLDAMGISPTVYAVVLSPPAITPEPSTIDGLLLATRACADLLAGDTAAKVRNGELGVRFRTGVDELSTVEAARMIKDAGGDLERRFVSIKMLKLSTTDTASQRVM
jgi:hypothetical protein